MSNETLSAPGDLAPKWSINFNTRASLARSLGQPVIVDDPVGLVIFGDTSTIYLAQVQDPGAGVYAKLPFIKGNYIHGWTVNSGRLYVLDGVELAAWDLREGQKRETINLLKGDDAKNALTALEGLKQAQQRLEWAMLLEQAEDEWLRVTAKQNAVAPVSTERDQLDTVAADFFRLLKSVREMTGSAGGGQSARTVVSELRKTVAAKHLETAKYCFSPPVIRKHSFEESLRAIFVVQGNGTIFTISKTLAEMDSKKWKDQAELQLALLEDQKMSARLLACVSDGTLRVLDAKTLEEKSFWKPAAPPAAGTTHLVAAVNGQFWWGSDSGVFACSVDETGRLSPALGSGIPWTNRQVGRLNSPVTTYDPPVDPNELFDTMNVRTWIERHADKTAPLNDGALTLLMLSDEAGKYKTPPEGKSYILHGPFARDTRMENCWTQIRPHHSGAMVLLSDNRGVSSFCRYPTIPNMSQLVPQWSVAPWFSPVVLYSQLDRDLSRAWPSPVRRVSSPHPDMVAWLRTTAAEKYKQFETFLSFTGRRPPSNQDVRILLWHALMGVPKDSSYHFYLMEGKPLLDVVFDANAQQALRTRFGQPGTTWDFLPGEAGNRNFLAKDACVVNFDPPWVNKSITAGLFHSTPPLWYDPWGFNRPGDFISEQPVGSFLDPFCFDKQLRVPQRPIIFDTRFKGRSWAIFTDNEPSLILRKNKTASEDAESAAPETEPQPLLAAGPDPSALVVTANEDSQRTTFQVLALRPLRITFDAASHTVQHEARDVGSIAGQVLASPVMYLNPASAPKTSPTAWCVSASDFPSARLRLLAKCNQDGFSPLDKFMETNAKYAPREAGKPGQIDLCPIPNEALPLINVLGFGVPVS